MSHTSPVTLLFADGASVRIEVPEGGRLIEATQAAGLHLLLDCANGQCGTCTAQLVSGRVAMDDYDTFVLPDEEREAGGVLPCVCRVHEPCALEFPYDATEAMSEEAEPIGGRIEVLEPEGRDTMRLAVRIDHRLTFEPGQYVHLQPEGLDVVRSYSMANAPGSDVLEFLIRLVPNGQFSSWLKSASVGDALRVGAPRGTFFLRNEARPRLMVAGGTGVAPFLAMLRQLPPTPSMLTTLIVGARTPEHLCGQAALKALQQAIPGLSIHWIVEESEAAGMDKGFPTDLLSRLSIDPHTRVYLCGPPPMVEAGRRAALAAGLTAGDVLCERFN